uniref:Uncharacterized protein n=1 Tax=Pelusios castaneus TaxID=367368 RepID=A0A8C8SIG6_9SAUR
MGGSGGTLAGRDTRPAHPGRSRWLRWGHGAAALGSPLLWLCQHPAHCSRLGVPQQAAALVSLGAGLWHLFCCWLCGGFSGWAWGGGVLDSHCTRQAGCTRPFHGPQAGSRGFHSVHIVPAAPSVTLRITVSSSSPSPPGSDDCQSERQVAATRQAGPSFWAGGFLCSIQLHQGRACETQSCLQVAQGLVAFEDVAVGFSPEEWAVLAQWQRDLYWAVMKDNYELVASLGTGSAVSGPAFLCETGRGDEPQAGRRESPCARSTGDGNGGDHLEKPGEVQKALRGAAAVPGPQEKVLNTCKDCGQSFSERSILIGHVLRAHLTEQAAPCAECGKILSSRSRLVAHQQAHVQERTFTCVECKCNVVYEQGWVERVRMELAGGKPFKCDKCSYQVVLMMDQLVGRERGTFPCPHCQKVFPFAYLLELHRLLHTGETAMTCAECGQHFRRRTALQKHRKSEAPVACPECGKTFPFRCSLKKHLESHALQWPFPCTHCGRRFRQTSSLAVHLRAHTHRQLHQCSQCSQWFGSQRALRAHQQAHVLERPCQECDERFGSWEAWDAHRLLHGRQKPFPCDQCGKAFVLKTNYMKHQRWHAGASPEGAAGTAPRGCPAGELGPTAGPATPAACQPRPGGSPAQAVVSLGQREGIVLHS